MLVIDYECLWKILFLKKIFIGYFQNFSKHVRDVKMDEIDTKIIVIGKWNITKVKERAISKNLKKIVFYNVHKVSQIFIIFLNILIRVNNLY